MFIIIELKIINSSGEVKFSEKGEKIDAEFNGAYHEGDKIVIHLKDCEYLAVKLDETLCESIVFVPNKLMEFTVPYGRLKVGYDKNAFSGETHKISVREPSEDEIYAKRNIALNSHDLSGMKGVYPHAHANLVTRNEPCFFERNAIDGVCENESHGNFPYHSWAAGARDSITLLGAASQRMAWVHREDAPGESTALNESATTTPAAETTPEPTTEPTATPEPTAAPTPEPTATPEPTVTPTPEPTAAPTPVDPTAGWPSDIEAKDLAGYGFAVTSTDTTQYEYTGWQDIDGVTYYYDPATHQPVTGQQVIQGNIYTFGADGALNRTARGIDVSKFQGSIDWNAVKNDGITFAIIRCGYRGYGSGALVEDSTYRRNIQGAINAGLKVGVYFYSQAVNEQEAVEEASMVLSLVSGYSLPLGVYYDTESVSGGRANALSAAERTACAVAFCETIRGAGYRAGVYSYASWFYNALNFANISKYNIWIAQYRDKLSFSYKYNIWQYTGSGRVNGISKPVDMNIG